MSEAGPWRCAAWSSRRGDGGGSGSSPRGALAMRESALARSRRRVGVGLSVLSVSWVFWMMTPGIPVLWASARRCVGAGGGAGPVRARVDAGRFLGGRRRAGPGVQRAVVRGLPLPGREWAGAARRSRTSRRSRPFRGRARPEVQGGVVHTFAVSKDCRESPAGLHDFFPVVKGGLKIVGGCTVEMRDFDPVQLQPVNPTALFGAGWVDRISGKSIVHQGRQRSWQVIGKEVVAEPERRPPGRPRVLPDGRIGKFGWKAQFATLEEFVAAACANELGLGNPMMEQARPWTRGDHAKVDADLDATQFRALVGFCDTLPGRWKSCRRTRRGGTRPSAARSCSGRSAARAVTRPTWAACRGFTATSSCTGSSTRAVRRADTPRNRPLPLPHEYPQPDEWKTPPLWGVADSPRTSTTAPRRPSKSRSAGTRGTRRASQRPSNRSTAAIARRSSASSRASRPPPKPSPPNPSPPSRARDHRDESLTSGRWQAGKWSESLRSVATAGS